MDLQENIKSIKLRDLNQRLGSLDDFYNRLSLKGLFLPKREKGCITSNYLLGVLTGKYFSIPRERVRIGFVLVKASKIDLYGMLQTHLIGKDLGFKITQLPDREWLESVLFSLDPNHKIFKKPEALIPERTFEIPEWYFFMQNIEFYFIFALGF